MAPFLGFKRTSTFELWNEDTERYESCENETPGAEEWITFRRVPSYSKIAGVLLTAGLLIASIVLSMTGTWATVGMTGPWASFLNVSLPMLLTVVFVTTYAGCARGYCGLPTCLNP